MNYAKKNEVSLGTKLRADGGFTCIAKDAVLEVQENEHGLFVCCDEGTHHLDGQLEKGEYIGLMLDDVARSSCFTSRSSASNASAAGRAANTP